MYHQIGPGSGDPHRDLVPQLDVEIFRAQLTYLKSHYELVSLRDLRARIADRSRGEPLPVALTFDDDLPSHSRYAAPFLEEAGAPGTFFLTGASLHGKRSFWWQDLQSVANRGGSVWRELVRGLEEMGVTASSASLRSLARVIEAMEPEDRERVGERIRAVAGPTPAEGQLSTDEIARIASSGFEIGFHTLRHHNLQTVRSERLTEALTDGLQEIQALTGYRPISIAYPHCRADARVTDAARGAGFELGLICGGGAVALEDDPLLVDRVDGWSKSVGALTFRLARAAARN
jgi:peptidoglycan/xylan/chitin deacetylase (PgdA/CDA1 family)